MVGRSDRPGSQYPPPQSGTINLDDFDEADEAEICCEACEEEESTIQQALYFCYACDFVFCDRCWNAQLPHRKRVGAKATGSAAIHERANPWVAKQVQNALSPPSNEDVYAKLCAQDENTAWFGVNRNVPSDQLLIFQDSGRFAEIMTGTRAEGSSRRLSWDSEVSKASARDMRTPSLVSFVGQSGAGKSTLINLLITFKGGAGRVQQPAPVVGMSGKDVPTSEDVHLYSDPATISSEAPLLYADCEGLEGGEREPVGTMFRRTRNETNTNYKKTQTDEVSRNQFGSERALLWANTPHRRTRQFAVTHLYPRLLYTFSDTIVFVLKNPRVIESVFERLIEWAAAALETSSNQPVLPCAIIALNASEVNLPAEMWDSDFVTNSLLESLSSTVHDNAAFRQYADFWKERGKYINTLQQLVQCYYSSIQIIRIPGAGRPKLIREQVEKLYGGIAHGCKTTRGLKQSLRLLLNATELQSYLHYAFDHFAHSLEEAFDFVQASFVNSPIPTDFGGNILRLGINITEQQGSKVGAREIFQQLALVVASCIMLDSVRHEIPGDAERILPEYLDHLDFALEDFCNRHWPCEFMAHGAEYPWWQQHLDGITAHRNLQQLVAKSKCVNVRSGHGSKGHQTKSGTIFASGAYVSSFSFEEDRGEFHHTVFTRLQELMTRLAERVNEGESQEAAAHDIHREETLLPMYQHTLRGSERFFYCHTICLGCLFDHPEHILPCGHILCTACIKDFGHVKGDSHVEVYQCPLDRNEFPEHKPAVIKLKPEAAGSRILVLDGGGIRAVVQLEILRLLENEWNERLQLSSFCDMIVGTNTSALIALGLTTQGWSLERCAHNIERLCKQAYARRPGRGLPGIGHLLESYSKSKYDTEALESAVTGTFHISQLLFGRAVESSPAFSPKVVVTATSSAGMPAVFANYNRRGTEQLPYKFCRPGQQYMEMKVWEAARATMSTPRLFKAFHHLPSRQVYTAADTWQINPVTVADKERKLVWTDGEGVRPPDFMISIGTGREAEPISSSNGSIASSSGSSVFGSIKKGKNGYRRASSPKRAQMVSDDFAHSISAVTAHLRYVRVNPTLVHLPAADDYSQMQSLKQLIRSHIDIKDIQGIARKLIATLFYFEPEGDSFTNIDQICTVKGYLLCRFANESTELSNLGKLLVEKSRTLPRFVIRTAGQHDQILDITPKITEEMIVRSRFVLPHVTVALSSKLSAVEAFLFLDEDEGCLISGFPRSLGIQETKAMKHRRALAARKAASGTLSSGSSSASIRSKSSKPWQAGGSGRSNSIVSSLSNRTKLLDGETASLVQQPTADSKTSLPAELPGSPVIVRTPPPTRIPAPTSPTSPTSSTFSGETLHGFPVARNASVSSRPYSTISTAMSEGPRSPVQPSKLSAFPPSAHHGRAYRKEIQIDVQPFREEEVEVEGQEPAGGKDVKQLEARLKELEALVLRMALEKESR
ncbi:hypothetical protein EJ06DRAFT_6418 [Trichodelitschia bisporula]|uniref:PNPLA domain-containing protein n=1 Tax=Trichodelitschia bisporula TaxID=703511 RepID=A0A6G1I9V9_9PEZI|nr:hypothetical protein EJ06DRAFT_6418 [Trichodelitschia bisporula]